MVEEIIKFTTIEQSKRIESFLFMWRVLMAIIITNIIMAKMGYHFVNAEIKLHTALLFLFSRAFFYASNIYLGFIFIFFWLLKTLLIIQRTICVSLWGENYAFKEKTILTFFPDSFVETSEGEWYLINESGYEYFSTIVTDMDEKGLSVLDSMFSIFGVLLATYIWWCMTPNVFVHNFVHIVILIVLFLAFVILLFMSLLISVVRSQGHSIIAKYKQKGYKK